MHLAQELLTNVQCSGQFKVCEGDESLEEEEHSGQPLEADNNWETSSKLILLQLQEKLPKNPSSTNHSMVTQHLTQIGKVKKLDKWVPQELSTNQGKCHFEVSSSLFLYNNNKTFLDLIVMYDKMDFIP